MRNFNSKYNYEYLIKNYSSGWGTLIFNHFTSKPFVLNKEGCLEAHVPMDSSEIAERIKKKAETYKEDSLSKTFSEKRLSFLCLTIEYLLEHGSVCLVRLPIANEIEEIEDQFMPNFNDLMLSLSRKYNIPYYNFLEGDQIEYQTFDGNHLSIASSKAFSRELALKIKASTGK